MPIVKEGDSIAEIDATVKNKWRWPWLNIKDADNNPYRVWCAKLDRAGLCLCRICNTELKYGTSGKKRLTDHANNPDHQKNLKNRKSCEDIQVHVEGQVQTSSHAVDGVADKKAKLLAFAAEHSLPFSLIPDLLDLCKVMSNNSKGLSKIHMSRQSATYSMTHGLAAALKNNLHTRLQSLFFSFNVDEATNNAMDKILNIVVRYFSDDDGEVKTEHFASRIVNQATAQNIHAAILDCLKEELQLDGTEHATVIPPSRIISCLMDNCATMRGVKGGVETLLRENNPNLLDVAGDTVHTVANAAKELFKPFQGYLEDIASDLYYDAHKSPKVKDLLGEVQLLLGSVQPLQVLRYCPSRFLQMLDVSERLHKLMDALRVYYYAFLTSEEQHQYSSVIDDIMKKHNLATDAAARIKVIQLQQAKQSKSSCSETRKDRLLNALFRDFHKFSTTVNLYRGLLTKFLGYTKLLQNEQPTLHLHHQEMFSLVRQVLSLFMKRKYIPIESVKELLKLKDLICDREKQLSDGKLGVGYYSFAAYTNALTEKHCHWVTDLAKNLRQGYERCATMLLQKLPLTNRTIIRLSCLHPAAFDEELFTTSITNLAKSLANVITEEEVGALNSETRDYSVDKDVASLVHSFDKTKRIDADFWALVFRLQSHGGIRYPLLSRLVKALLSIFNGPLVESSFNLMDDCIRVDRSKISVENYEATALIRSSLKSKKVSATTMTVTPQMARCIRTSKARYTKKQEQKKKQQREKQQKQLADAVQLLQKQKGSAKSVARPVSTANKNVLSNPPDSTSTNHISNVIVPSTPPASTTSTTPIIVSTAGKTVRTFPKGGKRAALQCTADIRALFKKQKTSD